MGKPAKPVYEFGPFRLDPAERLLLRDGQAVTLTPKVFDTLLVLVEQSGHLVEKDEMMTRLWPDTFVEEATLARNISDLRKALGETADGRKYITTVPKRGYRFVASVRDVDSEAYEVILQKRTSTQLRIEEEEIDQEVMSDADASLEASANLEIPALEDRPVPNPTASLAARSWRSNRKLIIACGLLMALVSIVTISRISPRNHRQASSALLASMRIKPLISWDSEVGAGEVSARFSPDGTMIAYSLMKNGQRNIWTKQVEDGRPNPITEGKWNDRSPIWSPDGQRIAFLSDRDNRRGIWETPSSGGALTLISPVDDGRISLKHWSKNGAIIYYQQDCNCFALDIASGQTTQLTNFDANNPAQFISLSPHEDRIAYSSGSGGQLRIFVLPIGGGQPVQVTHDEASDEYPFWLPDGKRMIYSSKRNGIFQLCIADLDEGKTEQLNLGISDTFITDISPDGSKILFEQVREECDLWQVRVAEKKETQLTADFGLEIWPDVSPDGKNIVFQAATEEKHLLEGSILIRSIDDNQRIQIAANGFNPTFSPDGRKIAFLRFFDNRINLWTTSNNGGQETPLTTDDIGFDGFSQMPHNRTQPKTYDWSLDGRRLIYGCAKTGLWNIWQVSSDGASESQQISNNTDPNLKLCCPLFSPDGKHLAYVSSLIKPPSAAQTLTSVCLLTGERVDIIFSSASVLKLIGWTRSSTHLIIAELEDKDIPKPAHFRLLRVSAAGNNWNDIAQIESAYFDNIQLSPDGRTVAFASREGGKDLIRVLSSAGGIGRNVIETSDPNVYIASITWSPDGQAIYYSKQRQVGLISMIENFN